MTPMKFLPFLKLSLIIHSYSSLSPGFFGREGIFFSGTQTGISSSRDLFYKDYYNKEHIIFYY